MVHTMRYGRLKITGRSAVYNLHAPAVNGAFLVRCGGEYQTMTIRTLEAVLKRGRQTSGPVVQGLLARMCDVSELMETLKQRFTI